MSAQIEVLLIDGGGTPEETAAANAAGQAAADTGQHQARDMTSRPANAAEPASKGQGPATETQNTSKRDTSRPASPETVSAKPETDPKTGQPIIAAEQADRLTDALDGLANLLERQAMGEVPAGSRRSDEAIERDPQGRKVTAGDVERAATPGDPKRSAGGPVGDMQSIGQQVAEVLEAMKPANLLDTLKKTIGRDRIERTERVENNVTRERTDRATSDQDRQRSDRSASDRDRQRTDNSRSDTLRERIIREVSRRAADTRVGRAVLGARDRMVGGLQRSRAFQAGVETLGKSRIGRSVVSRFAPPAASAARSAAPAVARAGTAIATRSAATAVVSGSAATAGTAAAGGAAAGTTAAAGGTAAAGALATVGAVAAPIAIAVASIGALALATKKLTDVFHKQADSLEGVSPAIAGARAQTDLRMEIARVERAEAIGGSVANVENASGRVQESMYRVQTQMLQVLTYLEPPLVKGMAGIELMTNLMRVANVQALRAAASRTATEEDDKFAKAEEKRAAKDTIKSLGRLIRDRDDQPQNDPLLQQLRDLEVEFNGQPNRIEPNAEI